MFVVVSNGGEKPNYKSQIGDCTFEYVCLSLLNSSSKLSQSMFRVNFSNNQISSEQNTIPLYKSFIIEHQKIHLFL